MRKLRAMNAHEERKNLLAVRLPAVPQNLVDAAERNGDVLPARRRKRARAGG